MTSVGNVSGGSGSAPLSFTGLASGLNTGEIISALLAVEREPVTHLTNEQTTLQGQTNALQQLQSSLTQLSFSAQELASPLLFHETQTVSSSNPAQMTATTSSGAAVGGYEVEVTQLANSAQRTFTFKSPAAAETLTIDGQEVELAAGASIQSLVSTINSDSKATVYAAALNGETLVLSTRATGATGSEFIKLTSPGGALTEQSALAKEGRDAQYFVDGAAASSATNTVTSAIPGVTLSLKALTTATGPVTVDVAAPAPSASAIVSQVQAFVNLYNSTVAAVGKQLSTKPPSNPQTTEERQTGTLFGDIDLESTINRMRQAVYEPVSGLPSEMSSLANIGISTGAAAGNGSISQASVEGQLKLNTEALESAVAANPSGVKEMLQKWSAGFQEIVNAEALPGGNIETRVNSDSGQIAEMTERITVMNEMIAVHQRALQQQYAAMEAAIAQSQAQGSWLSAQLASMLTGEVSSKP